MRKRIAESLGLQGHSELLSVTMLGGTTSETKRLQRVKFALSPVKGDSKLEMEAPYLFILFYLPHNNYKKYGKRRKKEVARRPDRNYRSL